MGWGHRRVCLDNRILQPRAQFKIARVYIKVLAVPHGSVRASFERIEYLHVSFSLTFCY